MLTPLQLLKAQLKEARESFEGTVADINPKDLNKDPGGKALPLGAAYAHLIFSEDVIIHGILQGKKALYEISWEGKTGVSAPMPAMDKKWSKNHALWIKTVRIDLPQLHKYAKAVYKATDTYMSKLKNKDLTTKIDLGSWGKKTVAEILSGFIIAHTNNLTGEISAIKGVHGSTGYPF